MVALGGLLAGLALGCAPAGDPLRLAGFAAPLAGAGETDLPAPRIEVSSPVLAPAGTLPSGKGTVAFSVSWPPLPVGSHTQTILDSATRVLFEMSKGGSLVASTSIDRPASTGAIELDAGSYALDATALASASTWVAVSSGSSNVTVVGGARVSATLTLGALVPDLGGAVAEP
jgi:hypothetical protein